MTLCVVREVVRAVVSSIVRRTILRVSYTVVSHIVCRIVSAVTTQIPSSAVSWAIWSAAGQVAIGIICRFVRQAACRVVRYTAVAAVFLVVRETTLPAVPHITP